MFKVGGISYEKRNTPKLPEAVKPGILTH